jgi:hypothetical protein
MTTLTVCNITQYQQSQQSYPCDGSNPPSISCLTAGDRIGLAVSILSNQSSSRTHPILQLTAEASFISSISVIVIFIWIGVRSISFHVSLLSEFCIVERTVV